jgi:hypothetical protein
MSSVDGPSENGHDQYFGPVRVLHAVVPGVTEDDDLERQLSGGLKPATEHLCSSIGAQPRTLASEIRIACTARRQT